MRKILVIGMLLFPLFSYSQKQDYNWCFGDSCGIHFTDTSAEMFTSALTYDTSYVLNLEIAASISDSSGNLLFYTNGPMVWNRNHELMPHGTGLKSYTTITNGSLILPKPEDPSLYYLFHESALPSGFYYALVNMELNNGLGDIVTGKKNVLLNNDLYLSEKLAAVRHANGRDWWIVTHASDSTLFQIFLLTPDTVFLNSTQSIGTNPYPGYDVFYGGEMIFSQSGNKLALVGGNGIANMFDFDRCTGTISNFIDLSGPFNDYYYGCSFSPNGSKLYTSSWGDLYQFNLSDSDIVASKTLIWHNPYYGFGSLYPLCEHQITPNGKIFLTMGHTIPTWTDTFITESLCVINAPNEEGAACDFIPLSFYLLGHTEDFGLPNSPNYNLGALEGSPCDTLSIPTLTSKLETPNFNLFPNPTTSSLNITYTIHQPATLTVYDALGRKVKSCTLASHQKTFELSVAELPAGVYLVAVNSGGRVFVEKVVKE